MGLIVIEARYRCSKCRAVNQAALIITDSKICSELRCEGCKTKFKVSFVDEEGFLDSILFKPDEIRRDSHGGKV